MNAVGKKTGDLTIAGGLFIDSLPLLVAAPARFFGYEDITMKIARQGELPIQYITLALWRNWLVIATVVGLVLLAAIIKLHFTAKAYSVSMGVVAVQQDGGGQQSTISQGLALFGAAPASEQDNLFTEYLEGLHSVETGRALMAQPALMHRIFASNWSEETHSWIQPNSVSIALKKFVKRMLGFSVPDWTQPNAQIVADYLQDNVGFEKNKESPIVRISVTTANPQLGLDLLYAVHRSSDGVLRQRALTRASNHIDYLNKRLNEATGVEYRQAIAGAIVSQEKTRMRAASVLPFAADIFASPSVSTMPVLPAASKSLVFATVLGLVLGVAAALACDRYAFDPFVAAKNWRSKQAANRGNL